MTKKKILVIDDEVDILDLVKARLQVNGYDVITASDGESGLAKMRKETPDAVILDILLPQADGLTILKKIREEDKTIPVFMYTAYSNEERIRLASKLNATGFIIKTSDLQGEIDKIKATLDIADKYKNKIK